MRVVSLVPSLTETLIAWGVTPIACTRFCEQPDIAHVGGTKDPDIKAIAALAPDLVLMDREENRREDADALEALGIGVLATHVTSLEDVAGMTTEVRARLGLDSGHHGSDRQRPSLLLVPHLGASAFVAIWRRPWMTCSSATYGSSLLASIGVVNVFAGESATYPVVTLAEVAARAPELVLLPSEPYPFRQRHVDEIHDAVPGAAVHMIDGQDLFWWGARTPAARLRLAQVLGGSSTSPKPT